MFTAIHIRPLLKEDYPACAKIYADGIATGIATFETQVPNWKTWDAKFLTQCRLVAYQEDKLLRWIALTPFSDREVYKGVAEVSLYISRQARGQGIGKRLLEKVVLKE